MKHNRVFPRSSSYLQLLADIAQPPKCLYLAGSVPEIRHPTVAIIGTRKPTTYGKEIGYRFAYELAARGVIILSGLALGLDSIAHQAALDAKGMTIAVLPGPLDAIYPYSHRKLAENIVGSGGALLSEYPPGAEIYPKNFIARNRIISGLADGVLVIEAAAKSGTMHTANFALEQGRAVMAVPGNITSPASEGCNNLIKSGARLITSIDDILDEIGLTADAQQTFLAPAENADEQKILELLAQGIRDGDELQQKSGLTPAVFSQSLTMLEITGRIRPLGANKWHHS
jgi:DNA processing protein